MPKRTTRVPLKVRRRRARYIAGALLGFVGVSLFVLFVFAVRLPEVRIASVAVSGTHYAREELVHQVATDMLKGAHLFIVPRDSAFLFPGGRAEQEIEGIFPPVAEVHVRRTSLTSLSVSVVERIPVALWCASHESASSTPCYLMDAGGYVFARPDGSEEEPFQTYAGALSGDPIKQTFLSGNFPELFSFINNLDEATGREPAAIAVDENDDVTVSFSEGGELQFVRQEGSKPLLDNIASVFGSRRFSTEEVLEYADFRFGNKVYVKFREE